jgi:hypothetical protein
MRGLYSWIRGEGAAGFRLRCLAGLCLAFALSSAVFPKEQSQSDTHILLIRGLVREIATSKVPLPRGKKGVRVDPQGKLDKADAASQLREHGMAIKAGMPVEITKLAFKSNEVVFELNGGGKSHNKWYQHIEIGMGPETTPIGQQPPPMTYGSSVTLVFPGKVPKLSADQVKQALGNVLDFSRHSPTVLYSPEVPPQVKEAIKKHEVIVGMDRDAVLSSKGPPDRKVRELRDGVEQEDWIYGLAPHVLFVTFDGDSVINVHQY